MARAASVTRRGRRRVILSIEEDGAGEGKVGIVNRGEVDPAVPGAHAISRSRKDLVRTSERSPL